MKPFELENFDIKSLEKIEGQVKEELIKRFMEQEFEPKAKNMCHDDKGKFICKHCSGTNTHKAGFNKNKKQRYKCVDCDRWMIEDVVSIHFWSKKSFNQWVIYFESLLNGDALTVAADKANISERTAFRWRHKILYVLNNRLNQSVLTDVVTLDETLFPVNEKGRKRIEEPTKLKPGMSNQKVNVTCAIDTLGNTILKVVDRGRVTSKSLIQAYDNRIEKGATVISDSLRSYHQLMKHLEINWIKIPSKKKSLGTYTLEAVNHLHALLKDFTYKYKGISERYLQGYCALFDYQRKHKNLYTRKQILSLVLDVFSTRGHLRCRDIDSNKTIYA